MSTVTTPQLHISFDFAERLLHQLHAAAQETGEKSFLEAAAALQAEVDRQTQTVQPEH
ncbi:hypothetical protein [Mesoterricola silvestris]|uniref:Uncharacterized protein n=1 Tax=Mesoterricola silvestris TaxID=2927979 RepID=A0AA48GMR7_9BACT|nr:hypothetical protein [Mesoterricola silvestris]BDU72719.1 hypothetical protein METEAL_18930 [Mesoterricola silvestris]